MELSGIGATPDAVSINEDSWHLNTQIIWQRQHSVHESEHKIFFYGSVFKKVLFFTITAVFFINSVSAVKLNVIFLPIKDYSPEKV